jgi:predicted nucleic acid-binding protein
METFLIDTNILIEILRGNEELRKDLEKKKDQAYLSFVTAGEIIQGARNKKELNLIEDFMETWEIDWGSRKIQERSLKILKNINLKNNLGLLDALIAATALENKSTLVTLNHRHFKDIENLKVQKDL